jgi:hypothetical protein
MRIIILMYTCCENIMLHLALLTLELELETIYGVVVRIFQLAMALDPYPQAESCQQWWIRIRSKHPTSFI